MIYGTWHLAYWGIARIGIFRRAGRLSRLDNRQPCKTTSNQRFDVDVDRQDVAAVALRYYEAALGGGDR